MHLPGFSSVRVRCLRRPASGAPCGGHPWGSHTAFCSHCLLQPAATSLRQLELDIHRRETQTAFLGIPNDACSTRQHSPENVPQDLQFPMAIDSHPSYTCTHGLDFDAAPEGDGVKMLQEAMQSSLHAHPRNTSFRHVRICTFNTKKNHQLRQALSIHSHASTHRGRYA